MRREVSLRTFAVFLLFASAAGAENRVAVLPLEPRAGALAATDALALTQDLRAAVADALAPHGYETVAGSGSDGPRGGDRVRSAQGRPARESAEVRHDGARPGSCPARAEAGSGHAEDAGPGGAAASPRAAAGASAAHSRAKSPTTAAATRASAASSSERGPARNPDPRGHRGRRAGPRPPPQAEPQGADPGRKALLGSGAGEGEEGADAGGGGRRARPLAGLQSRARRRRSRAGAPRRPRRAGGRVLRSVDQAALRPQGPAGLRGRRDGTRRSPADPRARDRARPSGPELRDPRPGRTAGRRHAPGP